MHFKLDNSVMPIRLSQPTVCRALDITAEGLRRLMLKDSTFPKPYKSGITRQSAVYFDYEEIVLWHKNQLGIGSQDKITVELDQDHFYRIKDLANIPERPARIHQFKSGVNKGKTRVIGARKESKGICGVSEKTLWVWVSKGEFPKPIELSRGITVWRKSDIDNWMKNKK